MTPIIKSRLGSFKNIKSKLRNINLSDTTTTHRELLTLHLTVNDLISIPNDSQICIVGNNDRLPTPCSFMNRRYKLRSNCLVIKVLLRLIQQQWRASKINDEVEKCQNKATLPG